MRFLAYWAATLAFFAVIGYLVAVVGTWSWTLPITEAWAFAAAINDQPHWMRALAVFGGFFLLLFSALHAAVQLAVGDHGMSPPPEPPEPRGTPIQQRRGRR